MALNTINSRILIAIHTAAEWAAVTETILNGELCFESDTNRFKIGQTTALTYSKLPYLNMGATVHTNEEWKNTFATYIPSANEFCYDRDLKVFKIGDGKTTYVNLASIFGDIVTHNASEFTTPTQVGTQITNAINALDAGEVGSAGGYIQKVSQANGVLAATRVAFDTSIGNTSNAPTSGAVKSYVDTAVDGVMQTAQQAQVFKGTIGSGGTINTDTVGKKLPVPNRETSGHTYKVITGGDYSVTDSTAKFTGVKEGDTFICYLKSGDTYSWILIPSGDEPGGTVTQVGTGTGLTGGPITTAGIIAHQDRPAAAPGYTAPSDNVIGSSGSRTYIKQVSIDSMGHVTGVITGTETVVNTDARYALSGDNSAITLTGSNGGSTTSITSVSTDLLANGAKTLIIKSALSN